MRAEKFGGILSLNKDTPVKRFPLLTLGLLGLGMAMPAVAQSPSASSDGAASPLAASLSERSECLSRYRLGSVQFDFGSSAHEQSVQPGEILQVTGTLRNTNAYPLPQGRIVARILRQDARVVAAHWHPIVSEQTLDGDYALGASGQRSFTFQWPVPEGAPAGLYRAEFFYLMGNRYIFSGIPYVSNFPGGTVLFSLRGTGNQKPLVEFDRASVKLNGQPLALRSVPKTLSPGSPVTVTANVIAPPAAGAQPSVSIPVSIRTALYEWSDTDGESPLEDATNAHVLASGENLPISFRWENARPGVYELVLTATPEDPALLPSLLRVRFPIAGYTPRIIFSGVTETSQATATVATCVVNGTKGKGTGSVTTRVLSNGAPVREVTDDTGLTLASSVFQVAVGSDALEVQTEARDEGGNVTDAHRIMYAPGTFAPLGETESQPLASGGGARTRNTLIVLGVLLVPLVALLVRIRHRRFQP